MIRTLATALCVAGTTALDDITYHGLTLGAPLPDTIIPHTSGLYGDK